MFFKKRMYLCRKEDNRMKAVSRFFNTAGPIQPDIHYNVNPLHRIDLDELEGLIRQRKYFILHAPRQTGKTSCLLALRDYLNEQGEYIAIYANIEAGQAARNDVRQVVLTTMSTIAERASIVLGNDQAVQLYKEVAKGEDSNSMLTIFLKRFCNSLPKPLVLLIDEIDALVGDSLVSVLRQIRAGYDQRPQYFPISIVLCGVRDVRDTASCFPTRTSSRAVRRSTSRRNRSDWVTSPRKKSTSSTCSIRLQRDRSSTRPVFP